MIAIAQSIAESDVSKATELDGGERQGPERMVTPDGAIRTAAKVAIDAGDFAKAAALLALLSGRDAKPENVFDLSARRRGGKR